MNNKKYPIGTICVYAGCNNKRRNYGGGKLVGLCEKHHRLKYPRKRGKGNRMDQFRCNTRKLVVN